jgi:hypothetical protein
MIRHSSARFRCAQFSRSLCLELTQLARVNLSRRLLSGREERICARHSSSGAEAGEDNLKFDHGYPIADKRRADLRIV